MSVAVVVPTYNEAHNLPVLVDRLFALNLPELKVMVVDDNSPDGTGEVAERLAYQHQGRIEVVHRRFKQGIGPAYIQGFAHVLQNGAAYIVQMDADLSHLPEDVPRLLQELEDKKADVVIGSRYVPGGGVDPSWSFGRKLLSRGGNLCLRVLSGVKVRDATAGFKAYRREALEAITTHSFKCKGFAFQAEVTQVSQRRGHRIVECPITFMDRTQGKSKLSIGIVTEALWRLLAIRWSK